MNEPVDWNSIAAPLDVSHVDVAPNYLRRWASYDPTESGLVFHCETASGKPVDFRVDVVAPDVIRVQMNAIRQRPSEMLTRKEWPAPSFDVKAGQDVVTLTTRRIRVEFQRYPWQMRVFAGQSSLPVFSERVDDRAYGPGYEISPVGFDGEGDAMTVRESVAVTPGEAFYGLGERFASLDQWGHEIVSWAVDSGNVTSHRAYKNIPFLMSTAGYGLFVHSSYPMVYRMGSESSISYSIHVDESQLDYFLIYGPEFKRILRRYTDLTGRAPVPPKWSFGFWISRAGYKTRDDVETVIREMRARDFPCDVLSLDPWWMGDGPWSTYEWDTHSFPQPEEMIRNLRAQGVRTCLWIHPNVPAGTPIYEEAQSRGYLVKKPDGAPAPVLEAFSGTDLAAVDFTHPDARAWFLSKLEALLDMGVAVFKTDFGEQSPVDAVYHDGRSGIEMHNLYPLLYNRAVFELTQRHFGRGLVWGRSAYAGSQRYPVQWGGDSYSSLDQMAGQLRGLLSYGMSGVPFCSHDVGGFDYAPQAFDHAERTSAWFLEDYPKDPTVYVRWLQFGVFSSHVRAHGKQPHEPWTYGPEAEEIARRYLKLRYRLLPYIYTEAVKSAHSGLPMVRPLVLEFQSDPNTQRIDWEYLFGSSFLVAPVLSAEGRCRVYLPHGDWMDYWTKKPQPGGQWIEFTAPLDKLPLWVQAGSILPMGPEMAQTEHKPLDPLTLELYAPQAEGELVVHDEDKPSIPVRYARKGNRLTVQVGAAPGQVELVIYGVTVSRATCNRRPLRVVNHHGGKRVRFDGTRPGTVVLTLLE